MCPGWKSYSNETRTSIFLFPAALFGVRRLLSHREAKTMIGNDVGFIRWREGATQWRVHTCCAATSWHISSFATPLPPRVVFTAGNWKFVWTTNGPEQLEFSTKVRDTYATGHHLNLKFITTKLAYSLLLFSPTLARSLANEHVGRRQRSISS